MTKIYDVAKIKFRTFIESINALFSMGSDLEDKVDTGLQSKQDTLVSGTNIKSVNGSSLLGDGNLVIVGDAPAIESGDAGKALIVNSLEDGTEWSEGIKVADTPANEHNAVNQTWVENVVYADDTVNNIVHKERDETIKGQKTFTNNDPLRIKTDFAYNERPTNTTFKRIYYIGKNNDEIASVGCIFRNNGAREAVLGVKAENGDQCIIRVQADNIGTVEEPVIVRYAKLSNVRVTSAAQVIGNTTYDEDIVNVKMLKNMGLIS